MANRWHCMAQVQRLFASNYKLIYHNLKDMRITSRATKLSWHKSETILSATSTNLPITHGPVEL